MYNNSNIIIYTLGLPNIKNLKDLSRALSISESLLYLMINKKDYMYKVYTIPKKNGSMRTISSPVLSLKLVQKWILKMILEKIKVSNNSMGFAKGKNGLKESAELHKNKLFMLQMDISDFFGSISKNKVYNLFISMGYGNKMAYILSELCTYNDKLPQGAVTSAYLANLICFRLDARLNGVCRRRDVIYSRYCDDLCFSSDNRLVLNKLEKIISSILKEEGFTVNDKKTRYSSPYSRKAVLNVTINDKELHANKSYKHLIRSRIFNMISSGDYSEREAVVGSISFVNSIEVGYKEKIIQYINGVIKKDFIVNDSRLVELYNNNKIYKECNDIVI